MATSDPDVECNECGKGLSWGQEYQIEPYDDDNQALCRECYHE